MAYNLLIDCRENAIVERFKGLIEKNEGIQTKQLPTCDFIFMKDGLPLVCVERKRVDDFASSIMDGRYKTQKLEMLSYANRYDPMPYMIYLVEGFDVRDDEDMKSNVSLQIKVTKETILSAMTKTMFRDGLSVVNTRDLDDTIRWISKVWENLLKGEFNKVTEEQAQLEYLEALHRKMSKGVSTTNLSSDTKANWWLMSLANIDGVSIFKAQQIVKKYPTVLSILIAYEECQTENDRCTMLSSIMAGTKRLGDALSGTIYKHITYIPDIVKSNKRETNENVGVNNTLPVNKTSDKTSDKVNTSKNNTKRTVTVKTSTPWKLDDAEECLIGSDSE